MVLQTTRVSHHCECWPFALVQDFFKVYISKSIAHHAKELKMVNCGVVAFNLEKGPMSYDKNTTGYRVDAGSISSLYGGFEKLKKDVPATKPLSLKAAGKGPAKRKNANDEESGGSGCSMM